MAAAIHLSRRRRHQEIDLDHLPATVTRSGSKVFGVIMVIFASVWGGFPLVGLAEHWPPTTENPEALLFLIFPTIGLGLIAFGVHQLVWRKTVTFDGHTVAVTERGLRGTANWREPLSGYRGVLRRTRVVRRKNSSYTLFLVDLLHDDEHKIVNLYTSTSDKDWRGKWEGYAQRLKMPAMEQDGEGLVAREVDDLDKSVGELISEGKVQVDYNVLHKKAKGLAADFEGDTIVLTRTGPQNSLLGSLFAVLFPLVFVYVGFFMEDVPRSFGWLFGGMGVLFEIGFVLGVAWDLVSRQRLRVGPRELQVNAIGPWGETKGKTMPVDQVEGVNTWRAKANRSRALVVSGDDDTLTFGANLPVESLDFLRNTVLAKIARHHGRRRR